MLDFSFRILERGEQVDAAQPIDDVFAEVKKIFEPYRDSVPVATV